jgi:hypothetical protein
VAGTWSGIASQELQLVRGGVAVEGEELGGRIGQDQGVDQGALTPELIEGLRVGLLDEGRDGAGSGAAALRGRIQPSSASFALGFAPSRTIRRSRRPRPTGEGAETVRRSAQSASSSIQMSPSRGFRRSKSTQRPSGDQTV